MSKDNTGQALQPDGIIPAGQHPGTMARAGYDPGQVIAEAIGLCEQVPEAPESDGTEMMARILAATSWHDLETMSGLPSGEAMANKPMTVYALSRAASTMDGILPYYLVVDAELRGMGKQVRWQTSAPGLVLPLCKLYVMGVLPAHVTVVPAERETRRGYRPLNLTVQGVTEPRGV